MTNYFKVVRRWYCKDCRKEYPVRGPYSCKKGHSVVRLCGYSLCFREVLPNRNSCDHEHDVLAARESAGKVLHPEFTTTSGEWLFRERLRLGMSRTQVCEPLTNRWGYLLHQTQLFRWEVDDLPILPDWLFPLIGMGFEPPMIAKHLGMKPDDELRRCEEAARAELAAAEVAMAIGTNREINSVKEVRLQLEQQRIVLVCGCGARTSIQIANDGHASLRTGSTE